MVVQLTATGSIVFVAFMMLYAAAHANNIAYNLHAGVWTSLPAASWPLLALHVVFVVLASFSMTVALLIGCIVSRQLHL